MDKWDLPGIASLLQSSPYVETLVIDIESSHHPILEVCFSWTNVPNVIPFLDLRSFYTYVI